MAFIHSASLPDVSGERTPPVQPHKISPAAIFAVSFAAVLAGYSIFVFNVRPMNAARSIINALIIRAGSAPAGKVDALVAELQRGINLNTFGTTEIREQANQIGDLLLRDPAIAQQDKQKYLAFVIEEMEKQRKEQPFDVRAMAFLSNAYAVAGRHNDAIAAVNDALKISDKRQQFYFIAAEAYLSSGQYDKALEALRTAYALDPTYEEVIQNLAIVLIVSRRQTEAEDLLEEHFGYRIPGDERYVAAYRSVGDLGKVAMVWEKLVAESPNNAQYRAELGGAYFQAGQKQKAIHEFEKAIELEPRFKEQGEQIFRQIRSTIK